MSEAEQIAQTYNKQHAQYERRIRPIFLRAIKEQIQPVVDWILRMKSTEPPLETLLHPDIMRYAIVEAWRIVAITAARREYYYQKKVDEKLDIGFLIDKWRKIFDDIAQVYAYSIEADLTTTTRDSVREALRQANEMGLNINRTATLIKKYAQGKLSRSRATTIARTEATTASNLGKITGAKEYFTETSQNGFKQWIGREDERERHTHNVLNDTFVPVDDFFDVGGYPALMPGDQKLPGKERIRCRCTTLFMSARRYNRMQAENN